MSDPVVGANDELPAYTPPAQPITHDYQLSDKNGHAWCTLKVRSTWPNASGQLPRLVEGQPVQGSVNFDLKESKDVKSITVAVIGELITEPNMRFSFVNVKEELWSRAKGDPATASSSEKGPSNGTSAPFKGKLLGSYSWPFSLHLPETVELEEGGVKKAFRLPSHTYTRWGRSDITYRMTVKIAYSSFLSPDHALGTIVGFIPLIRPAPPSPLRQLAYEQQTPIPGPDVDPEGWQMLAPVTFAGKIFEDRNAEVDYTLALAKPLTYTRGTVIPLHLTVRSTDSHALDLLSAPTAPIVRLRRITRDNYDAGGFNDSVAWTDKEKRLADLKPLPMMKFADLVGYMNKAVWWSVPSIADDPTVKTLQGELHLPVNLRPNVHLGLFKYFHDVALFTPSATGFTPETKRDEPWQKTEVEIATMHAHGPQTIAYSPPAYDEESKPQETRGTAFNQFKGLDLNY